MRLSFALLPALACLSAASVPPRSPSTPADTTPATSPITGDYVECRTASVFAGACHYNGERVTTGRDAVLAFRIDTGRWHGTDLAGVRAAASVDCDANLAESTAARRFELVVDGTPAQVAATAAMLSAKVAAQIGTPVSVRRGPVSFAKAGRAYAVSAPGLAEMTVQPMPDDACCSQPSMVWYAPLIPLNHRKVGCATHAAYTAGTNGDAWDRSGENDSFYGTFGL